MKTNFRIVSTGHVQFENMFDVVWCNETLMDPRTTDVAADVSVVEYEGEVLELTRISRLDMGAYLCIASNGVPPTVSKRIKVSVDCKYRVDQVRSI